MKVNLVGRIIGQLLAEELEAETLRAAAERVERLAARNWTRGSVQLRWAAPGLAVVLLHEASGELGGYVTVDAQPLPVGHSVPGAPLPSDKQVPAA